MTKRNAILIVIVTLFLTGCLHYNYGVARNSSPIPFINLYDTDDNDEYEFYSILFRRNPAEKYGDYVEITHLNDVYNHWQGTPKTTWKKSFLRFNLSKNSGVTLVPNSVTLQHFTTAGQFIQPIKIDSTLNECDQKTGCRGSLTLHYSSGIAESIIEKVKFTLLISNKEKKISYTIPLKYQYDYSLWDVMMGV